MPTGCPPFHHGYAAQGMRTHEVHRLLDAGRGTHDESGRSTDISQRGGGWVPRLGHDPHDDIAVGDHAAAPLVFEDDHLTTIRVLHGPGRLVHRRCIGHPAPPGETEHALGVLGSIL